MAVERLQASEGRWNVVPRLGAISIFFTRTSPNLGLLLVATLQMPHNASSSEQTWRRFGETSDKAPNITKNPP